MKTVKKSKRGFGSGNFEEVKNVTYLELVELQKNSQLEPNQMYRITDYVTKVSKNAEKYTKSAENRFDLIVTAYSKNELFEYARAIQNENTPYFNNADLDKWEIKYSLLNDNNSNHLEFDENSKGFIYYMKDEFNNECPYDFKNILFSHISGSNEYWLYTFNYTFNNPNDLTILISSDDEFKDIIVKSNTMKQNSFFHPLKEKNYISANRNLFILTKEFKNNNENIEFFNNKFDEKSTCNYLINNCSNNKFGCNSKNNILTNSNNNTFGNYCSYNVMNDNCFHNIIGSHSSENSFGKNCAYNLIEKYCTSNVFLDDCRKNTFDEYCCYNKLDSECKINYFKKYCDSNILESGCYENIFEIHSIKNKLGKGCNFNMFYSSKNVLEPNTAEYIFEYIE